MPFLSSCPHYTLQFLTMSPILLSSGVKNTHTLPLALPLLAGMMMITVYLVSVSAHAYTDVCVCVCVKVSAVVCVLERVSG